MNVLLIVDRIEEGVAVLLPQDGRPGEVKCPLPLLPPVNEGDAVRASFEQDSAATRRYREEAQALLKELLGE
jgi:hypothetical protein